MFSAKQYISIWLIIVLSSLGGLAATNYYFDPLGYFGKSQGKLVVRGFDREYKAWQIKYRQPDVILIGNSRNFFGTDISKITMKGSYNYSVPGNGLSYMERQLENLFYMKKPKALFLAVDITCSNPLSKDKVKLLATDFIGDVEVYWSRIPYLLSMDTLERSIKSINSHAYYDEYGKGKFILPPAKSKRNLLKRVEDREFKTFGEANKISEKTTICSTELLKNILTLVYDSNIPTSIIINPIHVRYMSLSYNLNPNRTNFMSMKPDLVRVNEELADKFDKTPLAIYDFRLVNKYTTEVFQFEKNIEPDYWYESSHYNEVLGNKMIEWMLSDENSRDASLGVVLTKDNVDQNTQKEIKALIEWNSENQFFSL
ncbi:MAG: hypothetical protein ACI87J_002365 [Colwellia sp.]|jgi:hypothetical protein